MKDLFTPIIFLFFSLAAAVTHYFFDVKSEESTTGFAAFLLHRLKGELFCLVVNKNR